MNIQLGKGVACLSVVSQVPELLFSKVESKEP